MARLPPSLIATLTLAVLTLAGCAQEPVQLPPLSEEDRARDTYLEGKPHDCTAVAVDAGETRLGRIRCSVGSGTVTLPVDGCDPSQRGWLSVETAPGHYGLGNATAALESGDEDVARLTIAASQDEGRETPVPAKAAFVLSMTIDGWQDKWVIATLECAAA